MLKASPRQPTEPPRRSLLLHYKNRSYDIKGFKDPQQFLAEHIELRIEIDQHLANNELQTRLDAQRVRRMGVSP